MRIVGAMSGTSLDGVDVAVVDVSGTTIETFAWRLVGFDCVPYDEAQRASIAAVIESGGVASVCALDTDLGEWIARAVLGVCHALDVDPGSVDLIGSHGQTVWHVPPMAGSGHGSRGSTLQVGDPATIVERTGVPVVSDFRSADMAAGGHGAPLVAWTDALMFAAPGRARCLQNVGGMANVTWLPPSGGTEHPFAFDTGPGGVLIDEAVRRMTGGDQTLDEDGRIAASGSVREGLLARLRDHPFFDESPPRSTGRESFGVEMVALAAEELGLDGGGGEGWADLVATFTELTAVSIADAYARWIRPRSIDEVLITGGGASNPVLVHRLEELLAPTPVLPGSRVLGFDADGKEAVAFAILAWAHVQGIPSNLPKATGAARPVVLGSMTPAAGAAPGSPRG